MRPSQLMLLAAAGVMSQAFAQDDTPDLSFLEYLGSWQEGDEDWLLVADMGNEIDAEDADDAGHQDDSEDEDPEREETVARDED
jgi:hypothetical protein